jgi:hypothetical protein
MLPTVVAARRREVGTRVASNERNDEKSPRVDEGLVERSSAVVADPLPSSQE